MKNLNIWAPIAQTGYGVSALNIITNLHKCNTVPYLKSMGGRCHVNNAEEKVIIQEALQRGQFPDKNSPSLKVWHQHQLSTQMVGKPYYAMPIFELDRFNEIERHHLQIPDHLIVNSNWAKSVVRTSIDRESFVVPLGVDTEIFKPKDNDHKTYNFINIGKWEVRKGHDILVDLFNRAFTKKDNVTLNLMPYNPFLSASQVHEWTSRYKNSPLGDKIFILPPVQTHAEIAGILNECDCGIFPTKAEGFALPILECLACGLPVITTNYSAHTEYCNENNSYLTCPTEYEDAYDDKWFHGQGQWMKITQDNEDEMIEYMRRCYKDRPNNPGGVSTAKKFNWLNTVQKLVNSIYGDE